MDFDHCYCEPLIAETTHGSASPIIAVEPLILSPAWAYRYDRRTDPSGNPRWISSGEKYGRTATAAGGAANPTAKKNGLPGYSFDGTDYLTFDQANILTGDPAFTVIAWARQTTSGTAGYAIYSVGDAVPNQARSIILSFTTATSAQLHFKSNAISTATAAFTVSVPFMTAFTKVPGAVNSTNVKGYINGVDVSLSGTGATPNVSSTAGYIGDYIGPSFKMVGDIYEVMEFSRVLSPAEIRWYFEMTRHIYGV